MTKLPDGFVIIAEPHGTSIKLRQQHLIMCRSLLTSRGVCTDAFAYFVFCFGTAKYFLLWLGYVLFKDVL